MGACPIGQDQLWRFRVKHFQALSCGDAAKSLIRYDEAINQAVLPQFQSDSELESVKGLQCAREAVAANKLFGGSQMIVPQSINRNSPRGNIQHHHRALGAGSVAIQFAGANLHRKNGLRLEDSQTGDSNLPARLGENSMHPLGPELRVIVFGEGARIEEILRQLILSAFSDDSFRYRAGDRR